MRASSGDLAAAMPVAIEMVEMPYPLNLPPMPLRAAYNHDNGGMRLVIDQGDDGGGISRPRITMTWMPRPRPLHISILTMVTLIMNLA